MRPVFLPRLFVNAVYILAIILMGVFHPEPSRAIGSGFADRPYMGWSSWSLEATKFPGYGGMGWLTAAHVKEQSDAMHRTLQKFGYKYVNLDSGWSGGYDEYGRPIPDGSKFPDGIKGIARYVHRNGQKLGIYWVPGIARDLYDRNPLILDTPYHLQDIVAKPLAPANSWGWHYKIDFSKPGAQDYIDSIASLFVSWGVDFLKLDGVVPGSDHDNTVDARPDVEAWAKAISKTHRKIWLELSWRIDSHYADFWSKYANGWRVGDDVDSYEDTLTDWGNIRRTFGAVAAWSGLSGKGIGWDDLDSLDVGNGEMDGLTDIERKTAVTLWAISCSPLYTGDDLTKLDPYGIRLLTNKEVIAVDQSGVPAVRVASGEKQVWCISRRDGSRIVALFNLSSTPSSVAASWSEIGVTGKAKVRDLWSHKNLGVFQGEFQANLPAHGCELVKIVDF